MPRNPWAAQRSNDSRMLSMPSRWNDCYSCGAQRLCFLLRRASVRTISASLLLHLRPYRVRGANRHLGRATVQLRPALVPCGLCAEPLAIALRLPRRGAAPNSSHLNPCSYCSLLSFYNGRRLLSYVPGWSQIFNAAHPSACFYALRDLGVLPPTSVRRLRARFLHIFRPPRHLPLQALNALNDEERAALMAGRSLASASAGGGPSMVSIVPHQQTMTAALVESESPVASAAASHS